jgi:hypothetical protein
MMPKISGKMIDLVVDGKTINIKTVEKRNFDLNRALQEPANFKRFVKDPKAFAAEFGLNIDIGIAKQLGNRLRGIDSLQRVQGLGRGDTVAATLWAVAAGVYSVASSKIAVAF